MIVFQVRCAALGAHPASQISWQEPQDANVDISKRPEIVSDSQTHTTDVYHTIKYKASLKDNDKRITCIATQLDRDGRTVMYESTTSVRLKVNKLVLPIDGAFTQKIGIISGVLLAIIFLILCIVFILFVVCKKRRRKRSRPPSSQATDDTSPDNSTTIKPIWTTLDPMRAQHVRRNNNVIVHRQEQPYTDLIENAGVEGQQPRIHHHHHHYLATSNGTMSTQSTGGGSQGSWEEDRSVGGELEDVVRHPPPQLNISSGAATTDLNISAPSPSLHETHFDESDFDYPRTVLHHPDPYNRKTQRPSVVHQRPSSSAEYGSPYYPGSSTMRPLSAMEGYDTFPGGRRMPTPSDLLNTSVKSVFDCEQGCFVETIDEDDQSEKLLKEKSEKEGATQQPSSTELRDV